MQLLVAATRRRRKSADTRGEVKAQDVLDFWFGAPGSAESGQLRAPWFRKDPAFDQLIAQRFGPTV
ncbi:MAG: DUF924 family protein, partial [Burkholderiales bacterium]|nr:DUF924 family protein [Burkholderiales bacterium]